MIKPVMAAVDEQKILAIFEILNARSEHRLPATDLGRFLERWPDETAIRQNLMDESWGERLATDLTGLSLQAPDQSPGWKTPFPLFRP